MRLNLVRCSPADDIKGSRWQCITHNMTTEKKVMTKKRSSDFWSRKVHPRRENPGYAYEVEIGPRCLLRLLV